MNKILKALVGSALAVTLLVAFFDQQVSADRIEGILVDKLVESFK